MKPLVRGNRDLIKAMNRSLLLNIIRQHGQLSRTQLTEISGLSVGAVSQIISDLIEKNWLLETGEGDYTGGRRQVFLRLNPHAGYAIGIKLMEDRLVCAITNFEGDIIHYQTASLGSEEYPEITCDALVQTIEDALQKSSTPRAMVLGVGIGLAGVIYQDTGVVHYSPYVGWKDFPLADTLQAQLHVPVFVENDVNTLTLSEYLFGAGRHHSDFAVITIGRGIGMGMVLNGHIYRGIQGGAGELGHIPLHLTTLMDKTTTTTTLETLAADPAVIRSLHEQGTNTPINDLTDVIKAAEAGDTAAQNALAKSGEFLGIGLATIVNILSPPLIIISGEGVSAGDFRLQPMLQSLQQHVFGGLSDMVEIVIEPTDDEAWARGAASLVMSKIFESPLVETTTVN